MSLEGVSGLSSQDRLSQDMLSQDRSSQVSLSQDRLSQNRSSKDRSSQDRSGQVHLRMEFDSSVGPTCYSSNCTN